MDKQQNSIEDNEKKGKMISDRKSFLEELAYCPDHMENENIKRYYVSPDEIEDIIENVFNDDEKEPEI